MQHVQTTPRKRPFFILITSITLALLASYMLYTTHIQQVEAAPTAQKVDIPENLATQDLKPFVGEWYVHFGALKIHENGTATYDARTYSTCGPGVAEPCDTFKGNTIYPGTHEELIIESVKDQIAYAKIVSSNQRTQGEQIILSLQPNNTLEFGKLILCGPQAPAGYCGA